MSKLHCIVLTKNEVDVAGACLSDAVKWADYLYVYDGASTDGTWELVQSLANSKLIPWKRDGKVFKEGLRAEVFNEFRHLSSEGDWWLQLNVDEFYPEDPQAFFRRVSARHNLVWGISVEYYLTWRDLECIDFADRFECRMPKLRYYKAFWSEPRAFRYRKRLTWNPDEAWPRHLGLVAPERIVFKHYPYRSPQQIQMRLDVRRENRARGFEGWRHANDTEWTAKIVSHEDCLYDDGHTPLKIVEKKLPRHIESQWRRWLKMSMHATRLWP